MYRLNSPCLIKTGIGHLKKYQERLIADKKDIVMLAQSTKNQVCSTGTHLESCSPNLDVPASFTTA
jgi:hypothetical protein